MHPWRAVVFYPTRNIETDGELHYSALLESQQVQRLYLEDLDNKPSQQVRVRLIQLINEDNRQAPEVARTLIQAIEKGELVADN